MRAEQERDHVEFVRSRIPRLHRVAYLVLGDRDRADDAVQNALTVLYRRWPRMGRWTTSTRTSTPWSCGPASPTGGVALALPEGYRSSEGQAISGDWAIGVASTSRGGDDGKAELVAQSTPLRWNLRTGAVDHGFPVVPTAVDGNGAIAGRGIGEQAADLARRHPLHAAVARSPGLRHGHRRRRPYAGRSRRRPRWPGAGGLARLLTPFTLGLHVCAQALRRTLRRRRPRVAVPCGGLRPGHPGTVRAWSRPRCRCCSTRWRVCWRGTSPGTTPSGGTTGTRGADDRAGTRRVRVTVGVRDQTRARPGRADLELHHRPRLRHARRP